jgi:hypothetical protein
MVGVVCISMTSAKQSDLARIAAGMAGEPDPEPAQGSEQPSIALEPR